MRHTYKCAIIGGGSIGVAWAIVFARADFGVVVYDADPARLERAPSELADRLADLEEHGLLDDPARAVAARVTYADDLETAVAGAAWIQECAPEEIDLKRTLFGQLDALAPPDAVLASSSSALTCDSFASALAGRHRCLVAHPANPPYLLPVVELVPAAFTSPDVTQAADELLSAAGMSPIIVRRELEGFVLNRLQGAILREAYCLVRDGVATVEEVDRCVRDGLGRRWALLGPFETADLNTRGGIGVHARRMGPAYARMGAERGQNDPWTEPLVALVESQRRSLLPLERWDERVRWRDRALMVLERARRQIPEDTGFAVDNLVT